VDLDKRKKVILENIIRTYLETGEPVGSRTLSKDDALGVSPATIRNEMADLEMLGYLEHIHTSSGRIPSSKGYRFYVDGLMQPKMLTDEEKAQMYAWLCEARDLAIDAESSNKKHEVFNKYKGRINNYLSARGYDITQERKAWEERVKARGGTL
jgi:heat shock gene repressor HrcA